MHYELRLDKNINVIKISFVVKNNQLKLIKFAYVYELNDGHVFLLLLRRIYYIV
jgi:hypothetical protein